MSPFSRTLALVFNTKMDSLLKLQRFATRKTGCLKTWRDAIRTCLDGVNASVCCTLICAVGLRLYTDVESRQDLHVQLVRVQEASW